MSEALLEIDLDSIQPIEIPVKLKGKSYVLREATEGAAIQYRNAVTRAIKVGPDGKVQSTEGLSETESLLVALCLFEKYEEGGQTKERPVILQQVKALSHRQQKILYEKLEKISDLGRVSDANALKKQIKELQEKLADLEKGEDASKN